MSAPASAARRRSCSAATVAAAMAAVLAAAAGWARAEIDFAASLSIPLDDDGRAFINVSSNYYHADPDVVVFASQRLRHPVDEIPVALFIADQARRPPRAVIDLRLSGKSWLDIYVSFGLPYSVLFADVPPDPGPPYGHAWGYWKKHRDNPRSRIVLTDVEFADLVNLRIAHRALGVDAHEVVRLRGQGRPFRVITGNAYRAKHGGKPEGKPGGKSVGKPGGEPKGGGKGKPKDHGKPGRN
jgi:hypothetical protein